MQLNTSIKRERYGWRAKIGLLSPAPNITLMREWNSVLPEGVICHEALMGITEPNVRGLLEMRRGAVMEAKKLASGLMDIILFACTSGSFIGGADYDKDIINELEAAVGVPSTTTSTCVLIAFADLGVKKIALIGPYLQEVLDIEVQFLKEHGIDATYVKGLEYDTQREFAQLHNQPYIFYHLVKEANRLAPDVDTIFITCMASPAIQVINVLECDTGKPIVSSCSAALYGVLKQLGIRESIEGYGQLLKKLGEKAN